MLTGELSMVNWRENIEFCYVFIMLIAGIVVFFSLYESRGVEFTGIVVAVMSLILAGVGFAAFESDKAIAKWEKLGKKPTN